MLASAFNFWAEWELQEKVDFNGAEKLITVYPGILTLDIRADVWSAWVRWDAILGLNYNRFLPAMERTGLDAIPGGQTGDFYFLTNGWKLVIDFSKTKVTGVLFSRDFVTAYYTDTLVPQFAAEVSAIVNTVTTTTNVIDATKEEIATEVWLNAVRTLTAQTGLTPEESAQLLSLPSANDILDEIL